MNLTPTRRDLLRSLAAIGTTTLLTPRALAQPPQPALEEFDYSQIQIRGPLQTTQREAVTTLLLGLDEDSLLLPFRAMAGKLAPGVSLGGWYEWKPDYNYHHDDAGLAPASTFGQWTSALARLHAASLFDSAVTQPALADRAVHLHALLAQAIEPAFFAQTRFPAYTLDKLVCGLLDAHRLLKDPTALATLDKVTGDALPSLPPQAVERDMQWKPGADLSWMWDESFTLPENLFLVSAAGAAPRYRRLAETYLLDKTFFEPLSRNTNVLADQHAYSHVNALCSAMQAYLVGGSRMHLEAARNGFAFLEQQSFATGGWGPDELLRKPGYDDLAKSLTASHNGFETPCGSYAHMKLTRYLLRATRDGHYGDSMERVFHNTILGALPLQPDGRSFYNADYNTLARRIYSVHRWPCCSGTYPQVVADYGINTYLRSPGGIWVNLYQPSALRFRQNSSEVLLEQTGAYPDENIVHLRLQTTQPTPFNIHLRVPAWATGASIRLNNRPIPVPIEHGFANIDRTWHTGDTIDLHLPMSLRLEPLPSHGATAHSETVALLHGPRVLFLLRDSIETGPLTLSREALLKAERVADREWSVASPTGPRRLVPFTEIGDSIYTTYVTASDSG